MKINVFLNANKKEFSQELKYVSDSINRDPSFNKCFNVYQSGEDCQKLPPDIYIGLIGNNYGFEYEKGISVTESALNSYFFVKMDEDADEKSREFFTRIKDLKMYKRFSSKEELLKEVKDILFECMILNSKSTFSDSLIIENSSFDDVDESAVMLFCSVLKDDDIKRSFNNCSFEEILEGIGGGNIDDKGVFHLNMAGALFFAKNPSKFGINSEIQILKFNGNTRKVVQDKLVIRKSILYAIQDFENFFAKNTKVQTIIKGSKSHDIPEYPIEAVREAFVNAIAHRDYSLNEDPIAVWMYDDRIVISNPGGLLSSQTVENITPNYRNKNVYRIFQYTKYVKHSGTGIARMTQEMLDSGLKAPEFYNTNYFKVILRGPDGKLIVCDKYVKKERVDLKDYNLNKRQIDALMLMCNENEIVTYDTYSKHFNISITTSKRDLNDLVKKELVIKFNEDKICKFSSNLIIKE